MCGAPETTTLHNLTYITMQRLLLIITALGIDDSRFINIPIKWE